jgi:hypothetical protein
MDSNCAPHRYDGYDRTDRLIPGLTGCPSCDCALESVDVSVTEPVAHITQDCPSCDFTTIVVKLEFPQRGYRIFTDPAISVVCDNDACTATADAVAVDSRRRRIETRCVAHEPCTGNGDLMLRD